MKKRKIQKKWIIKAAVPENIQAALNDFLPLLQKLLFHRGYHTRDAAEAYIAGRSIDDTSPFLLSEIETAVDRILFAVQSYEKIAIYGDYDADGVTSTALLMRIFEMLNANAVYHIPDRFEEGYGLNIQALKNLQEEGARLVITTDNGIRSVEEVEYARRKLHMDIIITDHHQPLQVIPQATAVVNPKKNGDSYPFKDLAGVGVAYKLVEALQDSLQKKNFITFSQGQVEDLLDYVAIGTVADVVPLIGENRALVKAGLEQLNCTQKVGLNALINGARLKKGSITAYNLGFMLGPRINAAGRLDNALDSLNLLLAKDEAYAAGLVERLNEKNNIRKMMTDEIVSLANEMVSEELDDAPIIFVYQEGFSIGLVGLAAAKLVEQYYCPVIVGELKDNFIRASCRSIPEFHITKALDECACLFERHGGHALAAGFTIHKNKVNELKERLKEIAKRELSSMDLTLKIFIDEEIDLHRLTPTQLKEYYQMVKMLEPTGQQNEEAVFVSYGVPIKSKRVFGENNIRLTLKCNSWILDAIGYGIADLLDDDSNTCDIVYTLGVDHFYHDSLLLKLKDIRASSASYFC